MGRGDAAVKMNWLKFLFAFFPGNYQNYHANCDCLAWFQLFFSPSVLSLFFLL